MDVIFGVPGDTSTTFHNALENHKDEITYISCRDERHASYMADTYARVTGKVGVVDVPSGGGVLYAVPGISEANSSSIPLLCISSDISIQSHETGALTELQQVELTKPITKWNAQIKLSSKVPHLLNKAFRMATGGRPGAVHLSIPENIHEQDHIFSEKDLTGSNTNNSTTPFKSGPADSDLRSVFELLMEASKPVIIAGGGVHLSTAYKELEVISQRYSIPVATTINGKGSVSELSPYAVGVIGVNGGSDETNSIIKQSDLVIVLGSKLNNVTTVNKDIFSNNPTIVQVDISEETLNLNIPVDVAILCDIRLFLAKLDSNTQEQKEFLTYKFKEWNESICKIVKEKFKRVEDEVNQETEFVNPAKIISILDKITNEDSIFVVDAGTQTPYMASNFKIKKAGRKTVFDRGHGNLGYALGSSLGAQVARPDTKVFSLFGDGSFAMSVGELETAKRLNLPIVFILLQNNSYGWIKKLHQLYHNEQYIAVDFTNFDAAKIAEGFGIQSLKINSNDKIEEGLKWAVEQNSPVFIDIRIASITDIIPPVVNWRKDSKIDPNKREALTY